MEPTSISNKPKLRVGRILIVLVVVLGVIGGGIFGYLKLSNQAKDLKQQKAEADIKIAELESKLQQAQSSNSTQNEEEAPTQSKTIPTAKDVSEINKLLDSLCQNLGAVDVTSATLQQKDGFGASRFYNGYAQVGVSCEGQNGGYISFMQRQADLSWKQLFGAQDVPGCDVANQYKIPHQILPNCISIQDQSTMPNTN